jgi:IS1 family transposase
MKNMAAERSRVQELLTAFLKAKYESDRTDRQFSRAERTCHKLARTIDLDRAYEIAGVNLADERMIRSSAKLREIRDELVAALVSRCKYPKKSTDGSQFITGPDKRGKSGVTGGAGKAIVAGAVQRKGRVVAKVVENVRADTLTEFIQGAVSANVDLVVTDKWVGYKHLGKKFPHEAVDHAAGEYRRGNAHTNTIEGYWSQLKRQIFGTHHWVSGKHLGRYVDESAWRYNRREAGEGVRFNDFLTGTAGRLTYKKLIA